MLYFVMFNEIKLLYTCKFIDCDTLVLYVLLWKMVYPPFKCFSRSCYGYTYPPWGRETKDDSRLDNYNTKYFKMVFMKSLLGAQGCRNSIMTNAAVSG